MADILYRFPIRGSAGRVFALMTEAEGLDGWWTKRSRGRALIGETYEFWFGPEYDWRGVVTRCEAGRSFEWTMTRAIEDWLDTRVGFELEEEDGVTTVAFYHAGWKDASEHFRATAFCWAMYLRILRRGLEFGEVVPYEARLDV